MHVYSEAEITWLRAQRPLLRLPELTAAFNARFGQDIAPHALRQACKRRGIYAQDDGRFRPEHVPHNKGNKGRMSSQVCADTWFKPGNRPHNTQPVGTVAWKGNSQRKPSPALYLYTKIAEPNQWRLSHHLLWEAAHGAIPAGHIVIFMDGDPANLQLDNLACISRQVAIRLNQMGFKDAPAAVKPSLLALAKLNSAIGAKRQST